MPAEWRFPAVLEKVRTRLASVRLHEHEEKILLLLALIVISVIVKF